MGATSLFPGLALRLSLALLTLGESSRYSPTIERAYGFIDNLGVLDRGCSRAHASGIHCQTVHPMPPADQVAVFAEAWDRCADALVVPHHSCYRQYIKMRLQYDVECAIFLLTMIEAWKA